MQIFGSEVVNPNIIVNEDGNIRRPEVRTT